MGLEIHFFPAKNIGHTFFNFVTDGQRFKYFVCVPNFRMFIFIKKMARTVECLCSKGAINKALPRNYLVSE